MRSIILCTLLLACIVTILSCGGCQAPPVTGGGGETPTEAYKKLYAAVKAKDVDAIKRQVSKKTIDFGNMVAERNKNPDIFKNGFTATTFSDSLPTIRDERINGDMGAVEVWNSRDSKWEDLPFVKEDGMWKLAVGDVFAGSYQSPGMGLDRKEKEAANAVANNAPIQSIDTNKIPVVNAMPPDMQKGAPKAK